MSIIPLPSCPPIVGKNWRFVAPTQVNRSEWTGRRTVAVLPQAPQLQCDVKPFVVLEEAHYWAWLAFFAKLRGRANSFRLPIVVRPQMTGVTVRVKGGGQTGYTLVTDGWGSTGLKAGQWVTVNDQALRLTEDVNPTGGEATLNFDRWLLSSPADDALVTVDTPTALMALADDLVSIDDDSSPSDPAGEGKWTIAFNCEEAF